MKLSDNVEILFCDNHVLVASKPVDLLTQPDGSGNRSLQEELSEWLRREHHKPGKVFLHCVHRLDRPVSGLVLFARTSKALSRLNKESRRWEIQRVYVAEVEGILAQRSGQLDHFLVHGDHRSRVVSEGTPGAKHARLRYEVLRYLSHSTLVQVELETGRYHQIRAQMGAMGHPVLGDQKYGARQKETWGIRLHATKIAFVHPVTKEPLQFESPPPFG